VREDLEIMITAAADDTGTDAPQLVFEGIHSLLSKQVAADRWGHALYRLKRYAGIDDRHNARDDAAQRYAPARNRAAVLANAAEEAA
jgi:hypothetical protein